MNTPNDSIRAMAQQLLEVEAAAHAASPRVLAAVRVSEKLRRSLARLVGQDGYTAILRRALVLAQDELPWLRAMKVTREGCLTGMEELHPDEAKAAEAAFVITTRILELLVTFIGESLTLRLVRSTWPDNSSGE